MSRIMNFTKIGAVKSTVYPGVLINSYPYLSHLLSYLCEFRYICT
jgi:hypothetical protein